MPGIKGITDRPQSIRSGASLPTAHIIQRRSDQLIEEQILAIRDTQDALHKTLVELERSESHEEIDVLKQRAEELKLKCEEMVVMLQIVNKVHTELTFARFEMEKCLKHGGDVAAARKRVSYLEDRMEGILGKRKLRSERDQMRSTGLTNVSPGQSYGATESSPFPFSPPVQESVVGTGAPSRISEGYSETRTTDGDFVHDLRSQGTMSEIDEAADILRIHQSDRYASPNREKSASKHKHFQRQSRVDIEESDGSGLDSPEPVRSKHDQSSIGGIIKHTSKYGYTDFDEHDIASDHHSDRLSVSLGDYERNVLGNIHNNPQSYADQETQREGLKGGIELRATNNRTGSQPDHGRYSPSSRSSYTRVSHEEDDELENMMVRPEHRQKSRVSFLTPDEDGRDLVVQEKETTATQQDVSSEYWTSEHHRLEYGKSSNYICQHNPLSYHQVGLAVPGTFVDEVKDVASSLPWRKLKGSDMIDIHRQALDKLSSTVHQMYDQVHNAAMLSVNPHIHDVKEQGPTLRQRSAEGQNSSRPLTTRSLPAVLQNDLEGADNAGSYNLPPLVKDSRGSLNGPGRFYSKPIPLPDYVPLTKTHSSLTNDSLSTYVTRSSAGRKVNFSLAIPRITPLPLTRANKSQSFPRMPECFAREEEKKQIDLGPKPPTRPRFPAERICNQRKLYKETKFTSSLYQGKPKRRQRGLLSEHEAEQRLREMLRSEQNLDSMGSQEQLRMQMVSGLNAARAVVTMQDGSTVVDGSSTYSGEGLANRWQSMKPHSGALSHSGLKWERVRGLVHTNLVSRNVQERREAAQHLGQMRCCDTFVTFALKERLKEDTDERVKYESAKSLVLLGCLEEEILDMLVSYLVIGNQEVQTDTLNTLCSSKNIHYIDKKTDVFSELVKVLTYLCKNPDPTDTISFDAAVCLGKLCVFDDSPVWRLRKAVVETKDTHLTSRALSTLVRQFNQKDWDLVAAILDQLQRSPVWKYRADAAKLLALLGPKHVCLESEVEKVFGLLERRLWDDPNPMVRQEVAKAVAALDMYQRACEKAQKRLEDSSEDIRAQAVISLGTLGFASEKVIRTLLEMLELDSSEYVRLMTIRSLGNMSVYDKRVVRALREREKLDGIIGREAKKSLASLSSVIPPTRQSVKKQSKNK